MAIIKLAVVRIIINSSYVLIVTTPFARLRSGWYHPSSCLGKYIIVNFEHYSIFRSAQAYPQVRVGVSKVGESAGVTERVTPCPTVLVPEIVTNQLDRYSFSSFWYLNKARQYFRVLCVLRQASYCEERGDPQAQHHAQHQIKLLALCFQIFLVLLGRFPHSNSI